jgi:hypothetical protein
LRFACCVSLLPKLVFLLESATRVPACKYDQ